MALTTARIDRACGVLLATAAGDALGAPYEFQPARGKEKDVAMVGGGGFGWAPGEWTDDTSMAIAIAEVAATGADLRDDAAQDAIVERWHELVTVREGRRHPDQQRPRSAWRTGRFRRQRQWTRRADCTSAPAAPRATAR